MQQHADNSHRHAKIVGLSPQVDRESGQIAPLYAAHHAGRHDSVDIVQTQSQPIQGPEEMKKRASALPPGPSAETSRASLLAPTEGRAANGEHTASRECWNTEATTEPFIVTPELDDSILDWEWKSEHVAASNMPHRAPCTFPTAPRDPFDSPPPIARLVQEVYIGHSPSPLLVPMQFSELPFEHGRVYPFGQGPTQHEPAEMYMHHFQSEMDRLLPCYPGELSPGPWLPVYEKAAQEMQSIASIDCELSSSMEAAKSLLSLGTVRLHDDVGYSSVQSTFPCSKGTQRPANRQCDVLHQRKFLRLPSSHLSAARFRGAPITRDSCYLPHALVLLKARKIQQVWKTDFIHRGDTVETRCASWSLAIPRDCRRPIQSGVVESADSFDLRKTSSRHCGSSSLKLPGLVSSSYFDLCHLMPTEEDTSERQSALSKDHIDEAAPRFIPDLQPSFFEDELEDISDTQELMGLVFRLISFGKLASLLLNSKSSGIVATNKICELQQEAAILSLATQLYHENLVEEQYTVQSAEGKDQLDAMVKGLIATEEITRSIASLKSYSRHDFMAPLRKLKRQTAALADGMTCLKGLFEKRQTSQSQPEPDVRTPQKAAQQTALPPVTKTKTEFTSAGGKVEAVSTFEASGLDESDGSEISRAEEPATICQRVKSLRERILSMHRMLDAARSIST